MQFVVPWTGSVNQYQKAIETGSFHIDDTLHCCAACEKRTSAHTGYERQVYSRGVARSITILRRYCRACGITYSFLPGFVAPRRRIHLDQLDHPAWDHLVEGKTIAAALSENADLTTKVLDSLLRWFSAHAPVLENALRALLGDIDSLVQRPPHRLGAPAPSKLRAPWRRHVQRLMILAQYLRTSSHSPKLLRNTAGGRLGLLIALIPGPLPYTA